MKTNVSLEYQGFDTFLMKLSKCLTAIWVFAAMIIVHVVVILAFCKLPQGKDVVGCASENWSQILTSSLAIVYWSFVTWYSARLVAYSRNDIYMAEEAQLGASDKSGIIRPIWRFAPRFLGHLCFSIAIVMVLLMSRNDNIPWIYVLICGLTSVALFFVLRRKIENLKWDFEKHYKRHIMLSILVFGIVIVAPAYYKWYFLDRLNGGVVVTIISLFLGQVLFMVVTTHRKTWLRAMAKHDASNQRVNRGFFHSLRIGIRKVNEYILYSVMNGELHKDMEKDKESEIRFLVVYNFLSLACIVIFICAFQSIGFARLIGSLAIVLLGLTLILGTVNIITIVSIKSKVKWFFILLVIGFVSGFVWEPHAIETLTISEGNDYQNRQEVDEYLKHWIASHEDEFKDSTRRVPMYFVLANGGASRSGYWAASVLDSLDIGTNSNFSKHLFCISGASGGSVGNAAFYAQLNLGQSSPSHERLKEVQQYVGADFLSFTAAKMLGPDLLNMVFSGFGFDDRSKGLQKSMEHVDGSEQMSACFAKPFSKLCTKKGQASSLPILFINVTRMHDGSPAVYSTVNTHNLNTKRIDLCDQMTDTTDVTLANAVVNGARFPFICPAGGMKDKYGKWQHYVDGGYFDNSGAGVVHELIQRIDSLIQNDPIYASKRDRIVMRIFHITNGEWSNASSGGSDKLNTVINDAAAPLLTLMGSYSMQTSVNDQRLISFVMNMGGTEPKYLPIPLLNDGENGENFTMNWVISKHVLKTMNKRLENQEFKLAYETVMADKYQQGINGQ